MPVLKELDDGASNLFVRILRRDGLGFEQHRDAVYVGREEVGRAEKLAKRLKALGWRDCEELEGRRRLWPSTACSRFFSVTSRSANSIPLWTEQSRPCRWTQRGGGVPLPAARPRPGGAGEALVRRLEPLHLRPQRGDLMSWDLSRLRRRRRCRRERQRGSRSQDDKSANASHCASFVASMLSRARHL
jgi:hypothetical protein